jgi:hypothetical protein
VCAPEAFTSRLTARITTYAITPWPSSSSAVEAASSPRPDGIAFERRAARAQVVERADAEELRPAPRGMDIEFSDVTFGYRADQDILQARASRERAPRGILTTGAAGLGPGLYGVA